MHPFASVTDFRFLNKVVLEQAECRMGTFMLYAFKLALFKQIWVVPLWILPNFQWSPPFELLKIKWSPPKSSDSPPQVINNDRSLNIMPTNRCAIKFWSWCHLSLPPWFTTSCAIITAGNMIKELITINVVMSAIVQACKNKIILNNIHWHIKMNFVGEGEPMHNHESGWDEEALEIAVGLCAVT